MLILPGVMLVLAMVGFLFLHRNEDKNEAGKETDEEKIEIENTEKTKAVIEENETKDFLGFEQLSQYLNKEQTEQIKMEILPFLLQDPAYNLVRSITCKGVINTENRIEFYCVFDENTDSVLYGRYDKDDEELLQWTEEISVDAAAKKWKEKESEVIDTEMWTEEQQMPEQWDYIEDDPRPVKIINRQDAERTIGTEKLQLFEEGLLSFLQENNEYRRELSIDTASIEKADDFIKIQADFQTQATQLNPQRIRASFENGRWEIDFDKEGSDWENGKN